MEERTLYPILFCHMKLCSYRDALEKDIIPSMTSKNIMSTKRPIYSSITRITRVRRETTDDE